MIGEKETIKVLSNFFKLNIIAPVSGLSNEILCILVAQKTAKVPKVYQSWRSMRSEKYSAARPNLHYLLEFGPGSIFESPILKFLKNSKEMCATFNVFMENSIDEM